MRPLRNQHIHSRGSGSRSRLGALNHHRIDRRYGHRHARNFSHLQSRPQKLDSRSPQRIAFQQRNLQLPLSQAQHHVRLLRHFHQQSRRRCLPHYHVNRLVAVDPVRHSQQQPTRLQHLARFGNILPHEIRHGHFAPVNRDAHRRDRAQKRRRRQNKNQQRHPSQPFQSLAQCHNPCRVGPAFLGGPLAPRSTKVSILPVISSTVSCARSPSVAPVFSQSSSWTISEYATTQLGIRRSLRGVW